MSELSEPVVSVSHGKNPVLVYHVTLNTIFKTIIQSSNDVHYHDKYKYCQFY